MIHFSLGAAREQQAIGSSPFHEYRIDDDTVWTEFYRVADGYLLRFPDLADFQVSADGKTVVAHPVGNTDETTIEHLYINQLVPLALSRQGQPAFHASVITVPGGCIAFLGKSGMGKSTLAASFALNGAAFLTDDALLIDESDGLRAMPSHASLRLWEDSATALLPADSPQAGAISYSSKARLLAGDAMRYSESPTTLLAAYVLERQDVSDVLISTLAGSERQLAWVGNSFLLDITDKELLSRHFDWTHRISKAIPTFSLDYPREYGKLETVRAAIAEHAIAVAN
jgi:hypothetical protein